MCHMVSSQAVLILLGQGKTKARTIDKTKHMSDALLDHLVNTPYEPSQGKCVLCIDVGTGELAKREYRVRHSLPSASCTAAVL